MRPLVLAAAVLGLLAGAVTLAILTSRVARRVLDDLDYYYYAAY